MENHLWNEIKSDSFYDTNKEKYQEHILEQYKLYVEMADRISARRNLANMFFLTLHSSIFGAIGFMIEKMVAISDKNTLVIPLLLLLTLCIIWWWLIKSYRLLNSAKYKVVGELEKKLPSSPYWSAEWKELGEGNDYTKYLPLTKLENVVPFIFMIFYILTFTYFLKN